MRTITAAPPITAQIGKNGGAAYCRRLRRARLVGRSCARSSLMTASAISSACPSASLIIAKNAPGYDADGDHDKQKYQKLADDVVENKGENGLSFADQRSAGEHTP